MNKNWKMKIWKVSAFSLIIVLEMLACWITFVESKFKISFNICSLSTCEKIKRDSRCFLYTLPILIVLGWFLYFTVDLKTVSLMKSKMRPQLAYSASLIVRLILGRKVFWIRALLTSLLSFSVTISSSKSL